MEPLLEVGIIYKNIQNEKFTNNQGVKQNIKVGVYDLLIKYPRQVEKSGKINMNTETRSDFKASDNNKFFISVSFDFVKNKGLLYIKSFDKYNNLETKNQIALSLNTEGKVFINKGFQLVTGDSSNPESSIHFENNTGKMIHYHSSEHLGKKSN